MKNHSTNSFDPSTGAGGFGKGLSRRQRTIDSIQQALPGAQVTAPHWQDVIDKITAILERVDREKVEAETVRVIVRAQAGAKEKRAQRMSESLR